MPVFVLSMHVFLVVMNDVGEVIVMDGDIAWFVHVYIR